MAVQYHYFSPEWKKEQNDGDRRRKREKEIQPVPTFSTNSWLVWKLSYSFNYSKLERSLQRADNNDKASVTSISLEIIWCQSLFICCISWIVVAELIHSDTFFGGETQREEMRKGCDLPCSNPFILSLNLIGVAHQIVSSDNRAFHVVSLRNLNVCIYVLPLTSISHLCFNSTKWQLVRAATCRFGSDWRESRACDVAADLLTASSQFHLM